MNPSDYRISLDLQAPHGAVELNMKQGDSHRCLYITLTDGGRLYTPAADCRAVFTAKKPDGTVLYNLCQVQEGVVVYPVTLQTTAAEGMVRCELRLYSRELELDGEGRPIPETARLLTAAAFSIRVHPPVCRDEDVMASVPEATALQALVAETDALLETVQEKLDTGALIGPKGDPGEKGDKGDTGEKGDKGEKGDPGWDTLEITVHDTDFQVSISAAMNYAQIHGICSRGGCLQGILHLTDSFGTAHTYRSADVQFDAYGYGFVFDGYGTVTVNSADEWDVEYAPVEKIGGVTYARWLGVRGAQTNEGEDPEGVFAEYAGLREDGVTDQVQLNSTLNYGSPVGIRGVAEGIGDTDAVNKKQLDDAGIALLDKVCPAFTESGSVVTCQPVEGYPLTVAAEDGATVTRCGKNLVTYPYRETTKTLYGITFTDNGDGSITLNGTATAHAYFYLRNSQKWDVKPGEQYTAKLHQVSGSKSGELQFVCNYYATGQTNYSSWMSASDFTPATGKCPAAMSYMAAYILVLNGTTCTDLVVKPQFEYGTVATEYVPYQKGGTFAAGEPIPALPGVNTLYADTGEITVTGRADPVARLNKLEAAVAALLEV